MLPLVSPHDSPVCLSGYVLCDVEIRGSCLVLVYVATLPSLLVVRQISYNIWGGEAGVDTFEYLFCDNFKHTL